MSSSTDNAGSHGGYAPCTPDPNLDLAGRAVLVTGATGTIGAEIVRQVLRRNPRVVRIFSRSENRQAHLRLDLPDDAPVRYLIGDIRDPQRLRHALEGIDVVFHTAALKHVPACEYNPFEAVQTNVIGTQNLVEGCLDAGVQRLIAISTDKAVNPVNTMGATKLLAENVLRDAQRWSRGLVIAVVRFGNVLGSAGSLLPLMVHGMEEHRTVRLTSPRMTRFMMTIHDAVTLVLEAAGAARGGEIFILKMPALGVQDLVEVFIEGYCERRGWDREEITVEEIGIRPGEKVYEELLTREEASRVEERERMFVVQPRREAVADLPDRDPPAGCRSDHAPRLERVEIRALIERSGVYEGASALRLGEPVS